MERSMWGLDKVRRMCVLSVPRGPMTIPMCLENLNSRTLHERCVLKGLHGTELILETVRSWNEQEIVSRALKFGINALACGPSRIYRHSVIQQLGCSFFLGSSQVKHFPWLLLTDANVLELGGPTACVAEGLWWWWCFCGFFFFRLHSTAVGTSLLGAALLQAGVRNSRDWRQKLRAKDFAVWGAASVTKQIVLSHMHCDAKHLHASFNAKQLRKKNIMLQMMEWHCESHMVVLAK